MIVIINLHIYHQLNGQYQIMMQVVKEVEC